MVQYKVISDICNGTRTSTRKVGDNVTAEDLWDTYVHVPGTAVIIDKPVEAMFHNGFKDFELEYDKKLELEKSVKFRDLFGYSAVVFDDDDNIQAWNPKVQGIGFVINKTDDDGLATEIEVYNDPNIMTGIGVKIQKDNFILLRTPEGLPGIRGLSRILNLVDVVRVNFEIWSEYAKYAFHQGLAVPKLRIKDLDDEKYAKVQSAVQAPSKDDAIIIDIEDDFQFESPQKDAYNPVQMLEYGDTYTTRESSLNKLQLYGDPGGIIATSETATANWYAHIKELQDAILPSIKPILERLGSTEKIQFNEPGEYNIATLMNGILQIRMALDGKVPDDQIVDQINKYMGLQGDDKFRALTDEEKQKIQEKQMGFQYNTKGENNNERSERRTE